MAEKSHGLLALLVLFSWTLMPSRAVDAAVSKGLTDVAGLKVGHVTLEKRPTGCTVVLAEAGAVGGVDVRGAAPGTRETDLLDPVNTVSQVHAVVLSGGSAFGLATADGVVRFLEERRIGFDMRVARVPIVVGAILFDLGVGDPGIRPDADCGYRAASAASDAAVAEGDVGAGAGATVGKLLGRSRAMKGGVGTASIVLADGLVVAALVAVNAVGDIVDPATGRVVAGARAEDGRTLADVRRLIRSDTLRQARPAENSTIGVVATNARLTKAQATKMAQMSHDGLARTIHPVHTPMDGDTMFSLATGQWAGEPDMLTIGALAAEVTADAVLRAVRASKGLPDFPAATSLPAGSR